MGFVRNWTSKVKGVEEIWTYLDKWVGGLENWAIFMEDICVSYLIVKCPNQATSFPE